MPYFLNPYQFIPTSHASKIAKDQDIADGNSPNIRHDVWQQETRSGRIACTLTAESPIMVGGIREPSGGTSEAARLQPYLRDGKPSIPGNSLRGMIGSILESLSSSSLRVLQDQSYSVRKPPNKALNMIGWLWKDGEQWWLTPYCLTSMLLLPGNEIRNIELYQKIFVDQTNREPMPLADILPAYVTASMLGNIKSASYDPTAPVYADPSLAGYRHVTLENIKNELAGQSRIMGLLRKKTIQIKKGTLKFLLGQQITGLRNEGDGGYQQGWIRELGLQRYSDILPSGKHFEYFIPEPADYAESLPVDKAVVDSYMKVALQRNEEDPNLPLCIAGQECWRDIEGKLVYFSAEDIGGTPAVTEIAMSAVWRKVVPRSTHDYFRDIDPDLLPWSGERENLTRAETMLGVVTDDKPIENKVLPALASRVRFFDAVLTADSSDRDVLMEEVKLQILSSPKPPSPSMYFRKGKGEPVSKMGLANDAGGIGPAGRKMYLHHPRAMAGDDGDLSKAVSPAAEDDTGNQQRVKITPVRKGARFQFHIDFDNLTPGELRLLISAVVPGGKFLHKIGTGKPLGLGSVKIDIDAIATFDRTMISYSPESLSQPPECQVHADAELDPAVRDRLSQNGRRALSSDVRPMRELKTDNSHINDAALKVIKTIGDPRYVGHEVCYPRTYTQFQQWQSRGQESELFEWFTENEKSKEEGRQGLGVVKPNEPLPPLRTSQDG